VIKRQPGDIVEFQKRNLFTDSIDVWDDHPIEVGMLISDEVSSFNGKNYRSVSIRTERGVVTYPELAIRVRRLC
jgi:hypothetical protein